MYGWTDRNDLQEGFLCCHQSISAGKEQGQRPRIEASRRCWYLLRAEQSLVLDQNCGDSRGLSIRFKPCGHFVEPALIKARMRYMLCTTRSFDLTTNVLKNSVLPKQVAGYQLGLRGCKQQESMVKLNQHRMLARGGSLFRSAIIPTIPGFGSFKSREETRSRYVEH